MNKKISIGIFAVIALTIVTVIILTNKQNNNQVAGVSASQTTVKNESALAKALGGNELIIGVDEAFPPSTFKASDGSFAGMDVDFANELGKRSGVKITFKPIEWDNIIPALLAKDIDVIWSGMGITDARLEKVDFVTYSKGPKGVAFVASNSNIYKASDLQGKVIAVQSGSYQEEDLKAGKIIPANSWKDLKSLATLPEAILDLQIGRVDVVIAGQDSAAYYIEKTLNQSASFRMVDVGYGEGKSGIAVRKDQPEVTAELQKLVNDIIKDGTATTISKSWLGVDKYANWQY